jgi:hypothetical protein
MTNHYVYRFQINGDNKNIFHGSLTLIGVEHADGKEILIQLIKSALIDVEKFNGSKLSDRDIMFHFVTLVLTTETVDP